MAAYGTRDGFLALYAELRDEICDELLPAYGMGAEVRAYTREVRCRRPPRGCWRAGRRVASRPSRER